MLKNLKNLTYFCPTVNEVRQSALIIESNSLQHHTNRICPNQIEKKREEAKNIKNLKNLIKILKTNLDIFQITTEMTVNRI